MAEFIAAVLEGLLGGLWEFGPRPVRIGCNVLSVVFLIALLGFLFWPRS